MITTTTKKNRFHWYEKAMSMNGQATELLIRMDLCHLSVVCCNSRTEKEPWCKIEGDTVSCMLQELAR